MVLTYNAYSETLEEQKKKGDQIKGLEDNVRLLKEGMNKIFVLIQQNPALVNIKPEILNEIKT